MTLPDGGLCELPFPKTSCSLSAVRCSRSPGSIMRAVQHNTAFVFPGQGSQYAGMGRDVADRYPVARGVFDEIDEALGFSISRLCFDGPEEDLKLTENTQPAILAVSCALHAVLEDRGVARRDIVAGHSLGEYSAIVSVGGLTAPQAARLVRARGRFMQEAVPVGSGGMAALIGPTVEEAKAICEEAAQGEVLSVANINAPGQIVIAGAKSAIDRAIAVAKARGVRRALPLAVSAPFHCELMRPAEERLKPLLDEAPLKDLRVSLVSNVDASPIGTSTALRNALLRQVASPVRWVESVQRMISMGVRRFVEIGPGSVLTGLIKRIDSSVELANVSDVASLEAFVKASGN
jgi:[acyl-carrier-protein] S-malonyltransferase